jgi:hypothetical protein
VFLVVDRPIEIKEDGIKLVQIQGHTDGV